MTEFAESNEADGAPGGSVGGEPAQGGSRDSGDHPDRRAPRGNPALEQLDVDRGLGKLERVSGN